jgi:hypothetical protein
LFTDLFRRYRLSTLFTGAEKLNALRRFLFDEQWVMTFGALTHYRFEIQGKLAIGIPIAGMKGLTVAGTALDQMTFVTLRTSDRGIIRFIDEFRMFTGRVLITADKHAKTPLAKHQFSAADRTQLSFQNLNDMPIRLPFQGTNIIALRIMGTAKKRPVFTASDN